VLEETPSSGVTGKLVSCTVSSVGAPLVPLLPAFAGCIVCSSASGLTSGAPAARSEDGGRMTMLDAIGGRSALRGERSDSRRAPDGGGDLSRGDIGQAGVLSPDTLEPDLEARGSLDADSATAAGWSWGIAAAESARCMAAADGTVCPDVMLGGL
jgi:hypothetical protein